MEYCSRHEAQRTLLPEAGKDDTLQFRDFHQQLRVAYVIYCNLEAFARRGGNDIDWHILLFPWFF